MPSTVYLSDLTPTTRTNGWGAYERDRSNGETGAADGRTLTLNGTTYAKGLGVHSFSSLTYPLGGSYSRFQSFIGIDDEVGSRGSVVFRVLADGVEIFRSSTLTGASATQSIDLNVAGRQSLQLIVDNADGSAAYDHANWADAKLINATAPTATLPSITLDLALASVHEDGTANLVYSFTRSGSTSSPLSVNYTLGGTATNGTDYTGISTAGTTKTVTFAAGSATALVTVNPTADTTVETNETVALTFAAGTGYTVSTTGAITGTISNDDIAPSPPPPSGSVGIPLSWNDPIFVNMTERTTTYSVPPRGSVSNLSITNSGADVSIVANGPATIDRVRVRGSEGFRGGSGEQYLSSMYIEIAATSSHSDALQMYQPGATGRMTLRNSYLKLLPPTPTTLHGNRAYFSSDGWWGAHVLENVILSGGGFSMGISGSGATSISLKDVYFEARTAKWGEIFNGAHNGVQPAIVRWENVRYVTIENGRIVPGDLIPQPYGIARSYKDAIIGTDEADVFNATASAGNTYVGKNGQDTYRMTAYNQSLLSNMDWLTDFSVGYDVIDGPNSQPITPAVLSQKATSFTEGAIGTLLNAPGNFPVNGAAIFKIGDIDGERVFLALNTGATLFSATEDSILEITGYAGNLSQLQVI